MKIEKCKFYTTRELQSRLKQVSMLKDDSVLPYKTADIHITDIHTNLLAPAQLYVLRSEFEKVRQLRWAMLDHCGVDILRLSDSKLDRGELVSSNSHFTDSVGFIEFSLDTNPDEIITITPPVIEEWTEADKTKVSIINDGMHRCFLARSSCIIPAVVKITNIPSHLPYYAFPLAGGWNDTTMIDKLNSKVLKKYHRFPNGVYQKYYRNFGTVFPGCGGPRGHG